MIEPPLSFVDTILNRVGEGANYLLTNPIKCCNNLKSPLGIFLTYGYLVPYDI